MAGPFSDVEQSIFAAKEVLSEGHQPDQILERDEEIDEYRHALEDVLFGRTPQNIMLYGKAGLGKTAVTKYMMEGGGRYYEYSLDLDPSIVLDIRQEIEAAGPG